ncbi:phage tail terminator-like protein [Castellaniella sp.]|uniref:phage tail terminator-like protein n=1 Tax=Castellaniella sp. TaxID=1955812 RepID=UPI00355DE47E
MKAIIRAAFEKKLADWAKARRPAIAVAYENVTFTPPADAPYLRCFLLPADTVDNTLAGDLREYKGLFQVNVVCPAGAGPQRAEHIAHHVCEQFKAHTRLSWRGKTVMIASPMREKPALQGANTYTIPMDCQYRATN